MSQPQTMLLFTIVAALAVAVSAGWKRNDLNRRVLANRASMAEHLSRNSRAGAEASSRIAQVVESDEGLFDETLMLMTMRRVVERVWAVASICAALAFAAWTTTGRLHRKHHLSKPNHSARRN